MAQSVKVRKQLCLTPTELDVLCRVKSAYWDRRFVPDVFYRFYHRSEKNACPDLNGLCPRPSICDISQRKSGTERVKKRKKRELVYFFHRQGAQLVLCPSYDNRLCVQESGLSRSRQTHTHVYSCAERISLVEHWKLVAESSEFHLTLIREHRLNRCMIERIFSNSKYAKKAEHFKLKAGKRDGAKKAWVYARKR